MTTVNVFRAKIDDELELKEFYYLAYGTRARYKYPERWYWQFVHNPFLTTNSLPVYYAVDSSGKVFGHTASCVVAAKTGNGTATLGWSIDTVVLPGFRGLGVGKKLQKINQNDHELFASLSMSTTNKNIKLKQGASLGPTARLYVKQMIFKNNLACRLIKLMQKQQTSENFENEFKVLGPTPASFGELEDGLWSKIRENYDFSVERNSKYLNWRYKEQPWTENYCCRIFSEANVLVGLIVYRKTIEATPTGAVILELFGDREKPIVFDLLLKKAIECLKKENVFQVQIAVSDPIIESSVQSLGFIKLEEKPLVFQTKTKNLDLTQTGTLVLLSKGDQDWDQYPLAQNYTTKGILGYASTTFNFKNTNNFFQKIILRFCFLAVRLALFLKPISQKPQ